MRNTLNFFELFVTDIGRAQRFYETVLGTKLSYESFNGEPTALFTDEGQGGALVQREGRKPSSDGVIVYVNCNGVLDDVIGRVEGAGGKVVVPRKDIGPPGFIALIADTEGNVVGLHSERSGA